MQTQPTLPETMALGSSDDKESTYNAGVLGSILLSICFIYSSVYLLIPNS